MVFAGKVLGLNAIDVNIRVQALCLGAESSPLLGISDLAAMTADSGGTAKARTGDV